MCFLQRWEIPYEPITFELCVRLLLYTLNSLSISSVSFKRPLKKVQIPKIAYELGLNVTIYMESIFLYISNPPICH